MPKSTCPQPKCQLASAILFAATCAPSKIIWQLAHFLRIRPEADDRPWVHDSGNCERDCRPFCSPICIVEERDCQHILNLSYDCTDYRVGGLRENYKLTIVLGATTIPAPESNDEPAVGRNRGVRGKCHKHGDPVCILNIIAESDGDRDDRAEIRRRSRHSSGSHNSTDSVPQSSPGTGDGAQGSHRVCNTRYRERRRLSAVESSAGEHHRLSAQMTSCLQ